MADAVLLVAHLGRSHLRRIKELGELLAGNGIRAVGIALLGISRSDRSDYYASYSPAFEDKMPPVTVRAAPVEQEQSS
jgi:hypothetical protein